jgi:hypothetical protein
VKQIALIANICDFQELEDSRQAQDDLVAVCDLLNRRRVALSLAIPFTMIVGDEVEAFFSSADGLWTSIFELEFAMHPVQLRYGIGLGEVTSKNDRGADGVEDEAFDRALASIEGLKSDRKNFRVQGLAEKNELVNHILNLVSHTRSSWRKNRIGTFLGLMRKEKAAETAERLSITEQAVYRNIRDGELGSLLGLLSQLSLLMNEQLRTRTPLGTN